MCEIIDFIKMADNFDHGNKKHQTQRCQSDWLQKLQGNCGKILWEVQKRM